MFSPSNQCCVGQDTCSRVHRNGLRSIGCTVAMVTTIMLSLLLKEMAKIRKIATNVKNTFIILN